MSAPTPAITIPADLLPADGRFGCGPSKVRPEALAALDEAAPTYLGTSHRQAPVKFMVSRLRNAVAEHPKPVTRAISAWPLAIATTCRPSVT